MAPPAVIEAKVTEVIRRDWGRLLAALTRQFGDFSLAEDCLQDAILRALKAWPKKGIPNAPDAWLISVARRAAIDRIRRDKILRRKTADLALTAESETDVDPVKEEIPDRRLELMFTCCHPAIEEKSRICLTLRALGGLTVDEIAHAFLDKPTAMAARLTRAKRKISDAGIPFRVPDLDELPERLAGVLRVIYLIFNEGYRTSSNELHMRDDLIREAISLARIVSHLLPNESEAQALLALFLLHESRREARLDGEGNIVAMEFQDRSLWNETFIEEGKALLVHALGPDPGPYALQAAISAVHAEAADFEATDWPQIVLLYDRLHRREPNPVILVNMAVAMTYAGQIQAAKSLLDELKDGARFTRYQPFYLASSEVHKRSGDNARAISDLKIAIELTTSKAERAFLERRLLAFDTASR